MQPECAQTTCDLPYTPIYQHAVKRRLCCDHTDSPHSCKRFLLFIARCFGQLFDVFSESFLSYTSLVCKQDNTGISLISSVLQFTFLQDDIGIPLNYRHMEGFGVHTFTLINKEGKITYVKFHWKPTCGVKNLLEEEAVHVGGSNHSHATQVSFTQQAQSADISLSLQGY